MAAGTVTVPAAGTRFKDVWGHSAVVPFTYTGPSTYTTGGETIAAGQVKLGAIEWVLGGYGIASSGAATAVIFMWNTVTGKLQAFWGNAGSASVLPEVTSNTDLSGYAALLIAFGKG